MTTYEIYECQEIREDCEPVDFEIRVDLARVSSGIEYRYFEEGPWHGTSYQTADACHRVRNAALLACHAACDASGDEYPDHVRVVREVVA